MNEKVKQAFKLFCEQYVKDLNRLENKEIAKDHFYNPKYKCGLQINGEIVYIADILKAFDNMEELIKGKDEYIAKLCNDRAELKEEIKRLDSQYKNIHNTKVKVPLCDILNGLSRSEREKVIEDIYYSQAERQDFYDNKISKLENELTELREFAKLFIADMVDVDCAKDCNTYDEYVSCYGRELKEAQFDLVKKVVEKYGK